MLIFFAPIWGVRILRLRLIVCWCRSGTMGSVYHYQLPRECCSTFFVLLALDPLCNSEENIADIEWGEFPTDLQEAGLRFMRHWADTLPIRHLRELSGFDDMSVEDLLQYAKESVEEGL